MGYLPRACWKRYVPRDFRRSSKMPGGLIKTSENWAILLIRLALGTIMFAHGAQKVFGWWGGPGFNQWTNQPAPFSEMRPSWLWMGAAALSELVGGSMVIIGLYTRIGAFFIRSEERRVGKGWRSRWWSV